MNSKTSSSIPADSEQRVAVVILNWNGQHYLERYLPGVVEHTKGIAEVWVADNGSDDSSIQWINANTPSVRIHQNGHNLGFAHGYNEALRHIEADVYILLNSDVDVTPNWIPPVLNFMDEAGLVACQPKILDFNRKEYFEHAGATGGFIDRNGFVFCAGRIFNAFEEDQGQYDTNKEVFWASGACLFIRATAYHEVDGLDADFFAHMEEIDLCWRLKNRGYRIGACGKSHVYHVGGGTLDKLNPFKTYLNFRNNLYILVKNYHYGSLWRILIKRMVLDGIAAFRFLAEGKWSYFTSVFKAHMAFYASFGSMYAKRKTISSQLKVIGALPNRKGWYKGSIIRDYFLSQITRFSDLPQDHFM